MVWTVWYIRLCRLLARLGIRLHASVMYIGGSDTLPAPLTREEEGRLLARLEGGDQYLNGEVKGCVVVDFKRVNLNQD